MFMKFFFFLTILSTNLFSALSALAFDEVTLEQAKATCKDWQVYNYASQEYCIANEFGTLSTRKQGRLVEESVNDQKNQIID